MKYTGLNNDKLAILEVKKSSVIVMRIMLSGIFLVASISHLTDIEKTVKRIEQASFGAIGQLFGSPEIAVIASGITMLVAGAALLIGFKTKWSAILLLLILIPITLTIQVGQTQTLGPLFKNIGLAGGLLFFILNDFDFHLKK